MKESPSKLRLDKLLLDRQLVPSRERAQALVLAGKVLVNGQKVEKSGTLIDASSEIRLLGDDLKYVGRGGLKLERAIVHWKIDVRDRACLDVGASTGGFTDCLLQHGAAKVHAVDTGAGQIDWRLRGDPRVVLHENFNARNLELADLGEPVDLAVCDVSFISATLIIPAIARILKPATGRMVILIKPQFEVGRGQVGKGGIVRDPELHQAACDKVRVGVEELSFAVEIAESPITGAEGNREFLLYGHQ